MTTSEMSIDDVNKRVSNASRLAFGAAKRANLSEGERQHTVGEAIAQTVARIASEHNVEIPSRSIAEGTDQGTVDQSQGKSRG